MKRIIWLNVFALLLAPSPGQAEQGCFQDCPPAQRDQQGCCVEATPPAQATLLPDRIETAGGIFFASGSPELLAESGPTLDRVVDLLQRHPEVNLEIQVHTDSQGSETFNLRLSHQRALVIREHLIGRGVSAARLGAAGYGESCPIAPNTTAAGRAANRRVVFLRTDPPGWQSPCRVPTPQAAPPGTFDVPQDDPQRQ